MKNFFANKVVVVTGASAGIGRATVREFAKHGAKIGLLARGVDGLEAARDEVQELGGTGLVVPTDVSDSAQVEAAAERIENELGPIDVWVNDAMVSIFGPLKEVAPEEFRRVTEVSYLGYVYGTIAALKRMLPRDSGAIVQVGSALAYRSIPLQAAYCGAKHAIVGFTESLRCELLHDKSNVHLTMVHLPGVNTPQFEWVENRMPRKSQPVGAVFQPEVAARAIVWAAEHKRREIFVGAPTVQAVLAEKVVPGLMDHYLAGMVYEKHMSDEPEDPNRPSNLWRPLGGDFGAHGPYDAKAKRRSAQFWITTHRRLLSIICATLAGVLIGACLSRRRKSLSENVGQTSCLPVDGASLPRRPGGRMPPEPAGWKPAPHFQTGS